MKTKKTVYGSMQDGGRMLKGRGVKATPAMKKKRRLKARAERKGIDTEGMQAVELGGRQVTAATRDAEAYDKRSQVYNPIRKKRLEERAEKLVGKTGQQMKSQPKAEGEASFKKPIGQVSSEAKKAQLRRAARAVKRYDKELSKQGRDRDRPDKPLKGRKPILRRNR
jgi:hypothetical protein